MEVSSLLVAYDFEAEIEFASILIVSIKITDVMHYIDAKG